MGLAGEVAPRRRFGRSGRQIGQGLQQPVDQIAALVPAPVQIRGQGRAYRRGRGGREGAGATAQRGRVAASGKATLPGLSSLAGMSCVVSWTRPGAAKPGQSRGSVIASARPFSAMPAWISPYQDVSLWLALVFQPQI